MSVTVKSGYTRSALHCEEVAGRAFEYLKDVEFDTVVGTGFSGILPLQHLAAALDKDFLAVRKPSENSHADSNAEGTLGERWLFVDDFISSGTTFVRVAEEIDRICLMRKHKTQCVGAFSYDDYEHHYRTFSQITDKFMLIEQYAKSVDPAFIRERERAKAERLVAARTADADIITFGDEQKGLFSFSLPTMPYDYQPVLTFT